MVRRLTNPEFKKRMHKMHGNKISVLQPYVNCNTKLLCECNVCGYTWRTRPSILLSGSGCPICSRKRHMFTDKAIRMKIHKIHGDKITMLQKYKGMWVKCLFHCNICGHTWKTTPGSIVTNKSGCPICGKKRSRRKNTLTNKEVKRKIHEIHGNKITMLQKYKTGRIKILFRCNVCGNIWKAAPTKIFEGRGCPVCDHYRGNRIHVPSSKTVKMKLHKVQGNKITMLKGYKGMTTKCWFRCNTCGHIWKTYPYILINIRSGCPKCCYKQVSYKERLSDKIIRKQIRKAHGSKLTMIQKYKGMNTECLFRCNVCGHIWKAAPHNIIRGAGCPHCNRHISYGEKYIYHWLRCHLHAYFNYGYVIPSNRLHFDFWIPSMKLAIEFDGAQHFKYVPYFCGNDPKQFKKAIYRDCRKNHYCLHHHIILIRIQNFQQICNHIHLRHIINHILPRVFTAYHHHHLHAHIYRFDVNHHGHLLHNRKRSA